MHVNLSTLLWAPLCVKEGPEESNRFWEQTQLCPEVCSHTTLWHMSSTGWNPISHRNGDVIRQLGHSRFEPGTLRQPLGHSSTRPGELPLAEVN